MFRGLVLASSGLTLGLLSVGAGWLCLQLFNKGKNTENQSLAIGLGMLVTAVLGVSAAMLWQNYTPTLFENAFGWNNIRGCTSLEGIVLSVIFSSLAAFVGYVTGVLIAFAVMREFPTVPLYTVLSFITAFGACWFITTEHLPRGIEATVEVRLWFDYKQPGWEGHLHEFYKWVPLEASPYGDYETISFHGQDAYAKEYGVTQTPTVTIRKVYYRNGDRDKVAAVFSKSLTGAFTAKEIADEVRKMQATRTIIHDQP